MEMTVSLSRIRSDLDRTMARLTAMEELVFRISPAEATDFLDTMEAIREYLRKAQYVSPAASQFIESRLPADWRQLARSRGSQVVFPLLAQNYSIVDARRKLG